MEWIREEIDTESFRDARLNLRALRIINGVMTHTRSGIPSNCSDMAATQGAYRFFNNAKVSPDAILEGHMSSTLDRVKSHEVVLAVEDTSFLSFGGERKKAQLGPHTTGNENGLNLHPCLAITPEGQNLGLLNCQLYAKDRDQGAKIDHKKRPIEEKESYRWFSGIEHCARLSEQAPETELVYVADRESDIYEVFHRGEELNMSWLVRAAYDRNTEEGSKLFEAARRAPDIGEVTWSMQARRGRSAREVRQHVKVATVELKPPRRFSQKYPSVAVRLVYAYEIDPPEDEAPVSWLLLTSLNVQTLEQAVEKIQWYRCRWQIEVFFKILKSGCGVEKLQLQSRRGLENATSLLMLVAWRIHHLSSAARHPTMSEMSCEYWLSTSEWKNIYLLHKRAKPPSKPPSIKDAVRMLGAIGGHLGRKHDGLPGHQTVGRGLNKLYQFIDNSELINELK